MMLAGGAPAMTSIGTQAKSMRQGLIAPKPAMAMKVPSARSSIQLSPSFVRASAPRGKQALSTASLVPRAASSQEQAELEAESPVVEVVSEADFPLAPSEQVRSLLSGEERLPSFPAYINGRGGK